MSYQKKIYINQKFNAIIELGDRMKKKKIKLKKTPLLILCIILILILGSISLTLKNKPKEKKKTNNTEQKLNSEEELKLEKLNHIEKKLSYFNYNYIDRYINYK